MTMLYAVLWVMSKLLITQLFSRDEKAPVRPFWKVIAHFATQMLSPVIDICEEHIGAMYVDDSLR